MHPSFRPGKLVHIRSLLSSGLRDRLLYQHQSLCSSPRAITAPSEVRSGRDILQNVATLCKQGHVPQALDILDRFEPAADCATYESLLRGCKSLVDVKRVHGHIFRSRLEYFMADSLVALYSKLGSLDDTQKMFGKMSKRKATAWNCLIAAYVKNGSLGSARRIFENVPDRSVASWNTIIAAFAKIGHGEEAMKLYERMLQDGVKPNRVTFVCVLNVCLTPAAVAALKLIHKHIFDSGLHLDVVLGTSLINMYGKYESLQDARRVFDRMLVRNARSWNTMIAVCNQFGEEEEALGLFYQMQKGGTKPDKFTFSCTLGACSTLTALTEGKLVHASICKNAIEFDLVLGADLISMYGTCGSLADAEKVFDKISKQDVVSWSAMISAYAKDGDGKKAIHYFRQMHEAGMTPNSITLVTVLSACNRADLVDEGRRLFDSMVNEYGIAPTKEHYMCMVDLLGRAGLLDEAEEITKQMPLESRVAAWMLLLYACKIHGNLKTGEHAARCVLRLDPQRRSAYAELCSIYTTAGRWEDAGKVKELMAVRCLR